MSLETITLVQFDSSVGPAEDGTLERMRSHIRAADTDLIVFPELATTGYSIFDQIEECAEPIPGPTTRLLGQAAAKSNTHVLLGMPVQGQNRVHNSAIWIDRQGKVRIQYDKRQLWGDERNVFTPGDDLVVVDCEGLTVGIQICYDLNFPEQAAAFARAEVDLLVNISAWSVPMKGDWDRLLPARAIETGAFVLGCNHAGNEGDLEFYGHSTVYDPDGSINRRLENEPDTVTWQFKEELLTQERKRNPMRKDRREYGPEIELVRVG